MQNAVHTILVLEDCPVTSLTIERAIESTLPHLRTVRARTVEEAQLLACDLAIDLFLVDVQLPDGSGLDFLCDIATIHPGARAIVMTAAPLPEYREESDRIGALRFFEKPLDLTVLMEAIRTALDPTAEIKRDEEEVDDSSFCATLNKLTPVDIIQIKCLSRSTAVIEFQSDEHRGRVHFLQGEIVHAEAADLVGIDAFNRIVGWHHGRVVEVANARTSRQTIVTNWQILLMNAAQIVDESQVS
ncbi:MAG TPA: DUF4388 domain-containing protein [Chthoniobacteraceae bacterium]|jgi:DNA-binding NarL/FixJ family response regulator